MCALFVQDKKPIPDLITTLTTKDMCFQYYTFLLEQKCEENLLFWIEVQLLKTEWDQKLMDSEGVLKRNESIWNKYFSSSGQYQLNVDWIIVKSVESQLAHRELSCSPTLFEKAQKDIYFLMFNDTFIKFKLIKKDTPKRGPVSFLKSLFSPRRKTNSQGRLRFTHSSQPLNSRVQTEAQSSFFNSSVALTQNSIDEALLENYFKRIKL
jgi:hypothetical protein